MFRINTVDTWSWHIGQLNTPQCTWAVSYKHLSNTQINNNITNWLTEQLEWLTKWGKYCVWNCINFSQQFTMSYCVYTIQIFLEHVQNWLINSFVKYYIEVSFLFLRSNKTNLQVMMVSLQCHITRHALKILFSNDYHLSWYRYSLINTHLVKRLQYVAQWPFKVRRNQFPVPPINLRL